MGWRKEPGPWEDTKAFLASFEQVALACQWPREVWAARLLPALSGEAQKAFGSLEATDREDYGKVKAAILRGEANRMETLRQHFRQFRYQEVEDPRHIYSQLRELCRQWLRPERHSKEQILELLILEQFLAILPPELQSWIRAGCPDNCTQATALVEDFLLSQPRAAKPRKWQGGHLSCQDLQETLFNPAEALSDKEAEQAEVSLPGSGSQWFWHSSSSLPPGRQERIEAGQVEALTTLEETGVSLHRTEQRLTQDQSQRTMFWQVLPDTSGKVDSLEAVLVPRAGNLLEKEGNMSLLFLEEREAFTVRDSGEEKGIQFQMDNLSSGGNKPGVPEKPQGDMVLTPEIQVEICESEGEWRKKSLQGQNDSHGLSEGLKAVCSQTHSEHPRKEEPLFSRYGQWDECSTSEDNSVLDEHQRISTGEKSYKCPIRGGFPKGVHLMKNQSGHMGENGESYCPENGESFTPKTLRRHLKIHREQTTYTCPVCGKSIKWKHDLNRHLRIHTGEKPFKCPECGISFSRIDGLCQHRRSHGRKMPYKCPECGKDFSQRRLMAIHQRIHT
ncbi:zinc finger protein with KRAB and SCAN domains 1-like [Heteronotia binoei]|uniref:zinc finger protein with KRAB and SCAN domains 1-like n=1 Tax=Heteronotia binoei TaxID=13085 RepID=UPI00292DF861|nr:zinc finger protein with KRAB and SCAN domains 1-like [Heteronotia binoei]